MSLGMPTKFHAGESLKWTVSLSDFPASAGWTLRYALVNDSAIYRFDTDASGDDHAVDVPAATTAQWVPGSYHWTAYVDNASGERHVVGDGTVRVLHDVTSSKPSDTRSHARKVLDAIEAALEKRASQADIDLLRAQFGEQRIERDPAKLIELRDRYRAEVRAEERAAAIERGEDLKPASIKVRF